MESIASLRRSVGMSQSQFAKRFNIPVRTLQQWEQGRSAPPDYVVSMVDEILRRSGVRSKSQKHYIPDRTSWKICIDTPFLNCERIYPIQQRKVKAIIEQALQDPDVQRIIIFGSSVTQACHIGSDVDVYFEMSDNHVPRFEDLDFEYDVWTNFTVDNRLKEEIAKKGVVVYDAS